jgi:hypothetical protein
VPSFGLSGLAVRHHYKIEACQRLLVSAYGFPYVALEAIAHHRPQRDLA